MDREVTPVSAKTLSLSSLLIIWLCSFATAQTEAANKKIIDEARQQYSLLRRQGLTEFNAAVTPNWEPLLAAVEPEERATALSFARRLRFLVTVNGESGSVKVTHTFVGPKPARVRMEALESIARGIEMSVTGFFMTWTPFMLTYVIPEQLDQFVFQDLENQYVVSYKDGASNVSVTMTKAFQITELKAPQGTVRPHLAPAKQGFLLTGYTGDFEAPDLGRVSLQTTITSVSVRGFSLPSKVVLLSAIGGGTNRVQLSFSNYQLKASSFKRPVSKGTK
jgi:hypothetical protein